jgi:hypothetical protein
MPRRHTNNLLGDESLGDGITVDDSWVVFIKDEYTDIVVAVHLNQIPFPTKGFGLVVDYLDHRATMGEFKDVINSNIAAIHLPSSSL